MFILCWNQVKTTNDKEITFSSPIIRKNKITLLVYFETQSS